jgi:hypothetical protein
MGAGPGGSARITGLDIPDTGSVSTLPVVYRLILSLPTDVK